MKLKGKRVIHLHTRQIQTIKHVHFNGLAEFEDGSKGDIHRTGEPLIQHGKVWKYIDDELFEKEQVKSINGYEIY
jgi:hypothetical protein